MVETRKVLISSTACLLTFGLGFASSVPAFADVGLTPKLSAKQAEQAAASMFPILSKCTLQNESYNSSSYGNPAAYQLNYQMTGANSGNYIYVSVDANAGVILNYTQPSLDNRFIFPVSLSAAKASQIAVDWAKKLYPTQFKNVMALPLTPSYGSLQGSTQYTFQYERVENGIPAPFDGFTLTIDQNGDLLSVQDNWTDLAFPTVKGMISRDQANAIYQKNVQLHLEYQSVYHMSGQPTTDLIYQPGDQAYANWWGTNYSNNASPEFPVIDAGNGQIIDAGGNVYQATPYVAPTPLVPGGSTLLAQLKPVNWTEQQALASAKDILGIPSADTLQNVNQYQGQGMDTNWSFTWQTPDQSTISATVDATYGLLVNFNTGVKPLTGGEQASAPKLTQEQVTTTVDAFVKKVLPNAVGGIAVVANTVPQDSSEPSLQTDYQIIFLTNGLPDQTRSGDVSVDAQTGKVQSLYINLQPSADSYPDQAKAMDEQRAVQLWVAARPFSLVYLLTQPQITASKIGVATAAKVEQQAVKLVYAPMANQNSTGQFNAITGKFETYDNKVPFAGTIKDLTGVTAAPQIQLLVDRELLTVDSNGNVHPNQTLTHSAFIKLLVDALGERGQFNVHTLASAAAKMALASVSTSSPDYQEIGAAYSLGWLPLGETFTPNQLTTRDYAAQILAKALNFQPLLSHPEAFVFKAKDAAAIADSHKVADALAVTLGLLPLQNGAFLPQTPITLSDAAIAVVQAAVIQGQQGTQSPYPIIMK